MQNQNFYSGMNPETIHNLSIKLRETNKDHEKLLYFLNEISKYLSKVELINRELNNYEHLFEMSNNKEELVMHYKKTKSASNILDKWIERIRSISNQEIKFSFERIESVLSESKKIIDDKLELENVFNRS